VVTVRPGFGTGIRARVGAYHVPLGTLLSAIASYFELEAVVEPGIEDYPILLAVLARRRPSI
jgi:hypothetical protein